MQVVRGAAWALVALVAVGALVPLGPASAESMPADEATTSPYAGDWKTLKAPVTPAMIEGRKVLSVDEFLALPPTIQADIGPGSALLQGVGGPGFLCTASFLLRDAATAQYYLATAGHCLVRDETDPTVYNGHDNPDKVNNHIEICVADCINNGLQLGTYVTLTAHDDYHPVAYARSGGVGEDFGIIELPAELRPKFRPEMPQWGGPSALDDGSNEQFVAHFGHGNVCCVVTAVVTRTPVDAGRFGPFEYRDAKSFGAYSWVTGGDSGSGAEFAQLDPAGIMKGTKALGTLTHAILGYGPETSGTLLTHSFEMVRTALGIELELVAEGDPMDQQPVPKAPEVFTIDSPQGGQKVNGDVQISGTVSGFDFDGAPLIEVAIDDDTFGAPLDTDGEDTAWFSVWDSAGITPGAHTIYARLSDDSGILAALHVNVNLDQNAPSTTVKPSAGGSVNPSTTTDGVDGDPSATADPTGQSSDPTHSAAKSSPGAGLAVLAGLVVVAAAWRRR